MAANGFSLIFFLKFSLSVNLRCNQKICSFTISLSFPRTHPLSSLSLVFYICFWLSNKPSKEIINNHKFVVIYARHFFKKPCLLHFCLEKRLLLKYFKNNFKIFQKHFLIVIIPFILRISLCIMCCWQFSAQ